MARLLLLLGSHEGAKAAEAERGNELAGLATKGDPSAARWRRWRHYAQQVTVRGRARVRVRVRVRVSVFAMHTCRRPPGCVWPAMFTSKATICATWPGVRG